MDFAKFIAEALKNHPELKTTLASKFEASPSTVERWAKGVAQPLARIQVLITTFITEYNRTHLEGRTWQEWYEAGLRSEKGLALGFALQAFEKALRLNQRSADARNARLRVAKYFTHNYEYRELVEASGPPKARSEREEIMSGRKLSLIEFDSWCKNGKITDAKEETFGDGYGEPYNPHRLLFGTLGKEDVWTVR